MEVSTLQTSGSSRAAGDRGVQRLQTAGDSFRAVDGPGSQKAHDRPAVGVENGRPAATVRRRGRKTEVPAAVSQGVAFPAGRPRSPGTTDRGDRIAGP